MDDRYRLAAVTSHPVQYQAPLFQKLARHPQIDLTVYYGSDFSIQGEVDPGFGVPVKWDRPLLDGYRSIFLTHGGRVRSRLAQLVVYARIIPELWRQRYDAVFIHSYATPLSLLAYIGAWLSRTPVLLHTESELLRPRGRRLEFAKQFILRLLFRRTAAFLTIGTANREFYVHYGVSPARMFHTPYSVDNDFFSAEFERLRPRRAELKRALGFPEDLPVIVFSGKLMELKRVVDLMWAYQRLTMQGKQAGLLIIGDGERRDELRSLIRQQKLSYARFVGFKNQTELPQFYICGDVLVLPSRSETWGLVVNEAMLFSMPVVTTDMVGAGKDLVVPGVTGYIYPAGDVSRLTELLADLLCDSLKRARMGEAARQRVAQYSYAVCVEGIVQAVQRVKRRHD